MSILDFFISRRRAPDWKMVHDRLYNKAKFHVQRRDVALSMGNAEVASEHQITSNILIGIADSIMFGMNASWKDLRD